MTRVDLAKSTKRFAVTTAYIVAVWLLLFTIRLFLSLLLLLSAAISSTTCPSDLFSSATSDHTAARRRCPWESRV